MKERKKIAIFEAVLTKNLFCNFQFSGHVDGIAFLDPKGDGRHLISNSKDQTIKLWDIRSV